MPPTPPFPRFRLTGPIADTDSTSPADALHPGLVVLVRTAQGVQRAILDHRLTQAWFAELAVGRAVELRGSVMDGYYFADSLAMLEHSGAATTIPRPGPRSR